jgi:formate dehydrogenase subunit delta
MNDVHDQPTSSADAANRLAKMGGQIMTFFAHYPEEQAVASIAQHINKFWSKKMRQDFLNKFGDDHQALPELLAKAISQIKN